MPKTRNCNGLPRPRLQTGAWLQLRIHLHALIHSPSPYLAALWWRVLGKRVRARARFAPLLALSPLAYRLWLRSETRAEPAIAAEEASPSIVALIYGSEKADRHGLQCTLHSLAVEGIAAVVVETTAAEAAGSIDWSMHPWLMPIAAGDVLAQGAGDAYRGSATTGTRLVYGDDDLIDAHGQRHAPHFKPIWNSELFRHFDYLTGACMVQAHAQDLIELTDPDWAERLVAAVAESGEGGGLHIPHVLHHRRTRPAPRVPASLVSELDLPAVSVIVPTRNRLDLLRTCIEGLERTDYPNIEIIVVDNGSDDPAALDYMASLDPNRHQVIRHPGPFNFSAINNDAADRARGELLCLLNNDIEVIEPGWLTTMAVQAMRANVGAVGAQLLYPDGRIQHAGVVLGICGGAAHAHRLLRPQDEGYHRRHALPQFVSAVTAACLVVQRVRFEAVGGLDEEKFAVAFNDVDLCMRLNQRGWQTLYEPRAKLIHHESVSRGFDRDPEGAARFAGELAALKAAWNTDTDVDPFHHPQLNRFSEHFVVRL